MLTNLEPAFKAALARYSAAAESFVSEQPYKLYEIEESSEESKRVFEVPVISFQWQEFFEGLSTMLIDDNDLRTICICKSVGSVRLPPYSHRRNERIVVITGVIIDHLMNTRHESGSIMDFSREVIRDLEFVDCVFNIILTPPLEFRNLKK